MKDLFLKIYEMVRLGQMDEAVGLLRSIGFSEPERQLATVKEMVYGDRNHRGRGVDKSTWWS